MRTDTKRKIIEVLAKRPHTRDQLVALTGLSRATIVNAIREMGLVKMPGTYPAYYMLAPDTEIASMNIDTLVSTPKATARLLVGHRQYDDWVPRWNGAVRHFGQLLSNLTIEPDSDPRQLYNELANAAETIASLAYALQVVKGKPDWYTLLGGNLESEQ